MKVRLSLNRVDILYRNLGSLDGFQKMGNQGQAVFTPYKFTDEVRRLIIKNRRALNPFIEDTTEFRKAVIREFTVSEDNPDGLQWIPESDEVARAKADRKMVLYLEKEEDVDLFHIEESSLLSENKNPIPPSVMEELAVIWDRDFMLAAKSEPEGGESPNGGTQD